ncbi:class I SAM-dependent DNA methyltransferase [Endozoicomonadaceae bacterium StTr2]
MSTDLFAHKAGSYDQVKRRVDNVNNIAAAIKKKVNFNPRMHIVDFGSGTGLLLEHIAPLVSKITAVDISESMNAQLEAKREQLPCELEIRPVNLVETGIDGEFDGVMSSMTFHHVENTRAIFDRLFTLIKPGGFIAIADLDTEDGSFHIEETGVYHTGFEREAIKNIARSAGFADIEVSSASVVHKPTGDYPVFLLTGRKPLQV